MGTLGIESSQEEVDDMIREIDQNNHLWARWALNRVKGRVFFTLIHDYVGPAHDAYNATSV